MLDELYFETSANTVHNLDILATEAGIARERRILELTDIAEEAARFVAGLLSEGFGIYEILPAISDGLCFGSYSEPEDALSDNIAGIRAYLDTLSHIDRATFADLLVSLLGDMGIQLSPADFLPPKPDESSVVYVRNPLSDEAYEVFSMQLCRPTVRYAGSISECVRMVADGECSFCILPLEERGGVRLSTVAELIYRNELFVSAVTPVFGLDGSSEMKYALVGRGALRLDSHTGDDLYLELRIGASDAGALAGLAAAVSVLSHSVYRLGTLTVYEEGEPFTHFTAVLRDGGRGFLGLIVYLALFSPDHSVTGMYKNLE